MRILIGVLCSAVGAWAGNACSTTGSGAAIWTDSTAWTSCGGSYPGNGDTVSSIGRPITVTTNQTVGSSPASAGQAAIVVVGPAGRLTIAPGVQLTARGDVKLNNATLSMGADSVLQFDPSAAASPGAAQYVLQIGTGNSQSPGSLLSILGTPGHPAIVRTSSGAVSTAYAAITDAGFIGGGHTQAQYFVFQRLGNSTTDAVRFSADKGAVYWKDGTFDTTADLKQAAACGANGRTTVTIQRVKFSNNIDGNQRSVNVTQCTANSSSALLDNVVMDGWWKSAGSLAGWTVTNSYFGAGADLVVGAWTLFQNNFLYLSQNGNWVSPGSVKDLYMTNQATANNQHWIGYQGGSYTFDGLVVEARNTGGDGDVVMASGTAGDKVLVKNSIKLPGAAGQSTGAMFSALGSADTVMTGEHNTVHLGGGVDSSGYRYGETFAGVAGMFPSIRCNLFWDTTVRGYKITAAVLPGITDAVTLADYNGGYNFAAGSEGKGYNIRTSYTPGAHDVAGDPLFVDSTRNLAAWAVKRGQANAADSLSTKQAAALSYLRADATQVGVRIADLIAFVRAGFVPRNPAYKGRCYDGTDIGAVPVIP